MRSGSWLPIGYRSSNEPRTGIQHQTGLLNECTRRQTLQQGGCRHDQQFPLQARQPVQSREPLGNDVLVGRKVVVWQCFPVGKGDHRKAIPGGEKFQLIMQQLGRLHIRCNHHNRTRVSVQRTGDGQRQTVTDQPGPHLPLATGRECGRKYAAGGQAGSDRSGSTGHKVVTGTESRAAHYGIFVIRKDYGDCSPPCRAAGRTAWYTIAGYS
jgi:hypothetical protein